MIYMLEAILFHQPTEMLFDVTCVNVAQKKEYVLFYGGCALGRCVNFVILLLPLPMFHSLQLLNGDDIHFCHLAIICKVLQGQDLEQFLAPLIIIP
jgi:hypothetical protein